MEQSIIETSASKASLDFIRSNLPIAPVPGVPEIRLHKAGPASGLSRLADSEPDFATPYWAYHWGGGLALARYVLDNPECVANRKVLDLGAGSGLVAIAAAKSGAGRVTAADIDPFAMAAIALNAAANNVAIATLLGDLTTGAPPSVEIVLVADLFYAADLAEQVTRFLDLCVAANIDILIGDPWRTYLPRKRLKLLAEYAGLDFGNRAASAHATNAVFDYLGQR
ncbi:MAG: 50S ribosomal protein L11 methyltransferase [Hyphomonadaceae bacterium]